MELRYLNVDNLDYRTQCFRRNVMIDEELHIGLNWDG